MSIESSEWRRVEHRVRLSLTEEDQFVAVNDGYGTARGKDFLVDSVRWPSGYMGTEGPADLDTRVGLQGLLYRKDGSLGSRQGTASTTVRNLPEAVAKEMLDATKRVYKP